MKKKLIPLAPIKDNMNKAEREAERLRKREEKAVYLGNMANEVLDAIEGVFNKTTPTPTGSDMIDVMTLTSIFLFSRQIGMSCKSKTTMQSVLKSTVWALKNSLDVYAEPLIKHEEEWDDLLEGREESDGSN